jgi:phytoene desaturase
MMSKKRIIIIGAGPGGLTSGMILAHRGFDVTIYEKKPHVGGRNARLQLGEYKFDTGPTFLMMSFILQQMFEETGRKMEDYLKLIELEPLYRLKFGDKELFPSLDRAKAKADIQRNFPGEESNLDRFFEKESKRFEMIYPCLQQDYASLGRMVGKPIRRALPYLGLTKKLFQKLGDYFAPRDLRLSFTFQAKYLGMSPWECPSLFIIISYVEHAFGIQHVEGGLNHISTSMAKIVEEEGGTIHLNTAVKQLVLDGNVVTGVELEDGKQDYADAVIINADFAHAMTHLVQDGVLKKYTPAKLKKKKYSCSIFMLYLGVNKQYDIPHHNVFFSEDYEGYVRKIFNNEMVEDDLSFYVQNASCSDPTLAPPGKSTIYVLVPVPNRRAQVDWAAEKQRFSEYVIDQIETRTELTDIRNHIEEKHAITPDEWEHDYDVYNGAVFNLGHNISQMLYLRPRNRFEELHQCYLVGGGTHPGSGLPTIYESARISSNLICEQLGVDYTPPKPFSEIKDQLHPHRSIPGLD